MIALRALVASAVVASLALASAARAQDEATAPEQRLARELFARGMAAIGESRWADAESSFERSYELVPAPDTLLNLAAAYGRNEHFVESAEAYRTFLRDVRDGPLAVHRDAARQALSDVEARLGRIRIDVENLSDDDVLAIDERVLVHAVVGQAIDENPGQRTVTVRRDEEQIARRAVEVTVGQVVDVRLSLPVPRPPEPPAPLSYLLRDAENEDGGGVLSSPWFWVVAGLLVAGGVTAAVLVATWPEPERYPASLGQLDL